MAGFNTCENWEKGLFFLRETLERDDKDAIVENDMPVVLYEEMAEEELKSIRAIQKESGTSFKEMYQVFNMGHRMEIYLNPNHAEDVIQIAQSFGIPAQIVGYVEGNAGKKLTIRNQGEEYIYE